MEYITLSQLNLLIREEIGNAFPDTYWIIAETSDVRLNQNGNCYLEFIEKKEPGNNIIAKARGYIWANTYRMLKPYFEEKTGQSFVSGLKVLVKIAVDFHPLYGYGLNVCDIDPAYTAGDMQQHRKQILNRLEKEGILSLNKELEMPLLPQRIAVITSPTAAGYEDFMNHLANNKHGFVFYTHLFPSVMQGEQTEKTIINALNRIYEYRELFDLVVIIRGGGATSDLASFDTFALAANCAQFPLPIITGIGHERDDTVLDYVSNYRAKTPTAAADYLSTCLEDAFSALRATQTNLIAAAKRIPDASFEKMQQLIHHLHVYAYNYIEKQNGTLDLINDNLHQCLRRFLLSEETKLKEKASFFKLSSPQYILSKGYSITLKDGKAVKSTQSLQEGDSIETILMEGKFGSTVSFRR
jgi:exodeoxyribonuclease VII large subunit